jgi:hypothetical protein
MLPEVCKEELNNHSFGLLREIWIDCLSFLDKRLIDGNNYVEKTEGKNKNYL